MNDPAQTIDALALLNEATTGMAGCRAAEAARRKTNHNECGAAELADIAQLSNRIGFGVNCGAVGAVGGTDTVLADGQDFAAAEQNRDMGIINTGLLGVATLLGENVGVQSAGYPGGKRRRRVSWRKGGHVCG